jgi:hypothetical protein
MAQTKKDVTLRLGDKSYQLTQEQAKKLGTELIAASERAALRSKAKPTRRTPQPARSAPAPTQRKAAPVQKAPAPRDPLARMLGGSITVVR